MGSSRLAVVAVLGVLVDQFLKSMLTIPARTSRVFGSSWFPSDQACNVSARNAEHCRQPLMPIAKIAWLVAIGLRQSFDSIGEVVAVVERRAPMMMSSTPGQVVMYDTAPVSVSIVVTAI